MTRYHTKSLFENDEVESHEAGHVVRIAFDTGADAEFDYVVGDSLWPVDVGQRLQVPFGRSNKVTTGFCVGVIENTDERQKARRFKLKSVNKVLDDEPLIDAELMELARWISSYYVCPLGQVLAAMVPAAVKKGVGVKKEVYVYLAGRGDGDSGPFRFRRSSDGYARRSGWWRVKPSPRSARRSSTLSIILNVQLASVGKAPSA